MADFIQVPFASEGDRSPIPINPPQENTVNYKQGFNSTYSTDPRSGGHYIPREEFNALMYNMTNCIQDLQHRGIREFDPDVTTAIGGYSAGDVCLVNYDIFTHEVVASPNPLNPFINKIQVMSLKDNNTSSPYDVLTLNNEWFILDGKDFGEIKIFSTQLIKDPSGYVSLATGAPGSYNFIAYPRVAYAMKDLSIGDKLGILYKKDDVSFSIQDVRGYFFREWSNGSTIDSARVFGALQGDAIRDFNITTGGANQQYFLGNFNRGGNIYGEFSPGGGNYIYGKPSLSEPAVPTTDPITGENRPYNFNITIAIKI